MAGYLSSIFNNGKVKTISKNLRKISAFGTDYEDLAVKQSMAIGKTEAEFSKMTGTGAMPLDMIYSLSMADIGEKKYIAYFDNVYLQRRDFLRKFALNGEIEWILDTVCDEAIVYDDDNFFCTPDTRGLGQHLTPDFAQKIDDDIFSTFKSLYFKFGFNNSVKAWEAFRRFLIEGFLAYEIIYNKSNTKIINIKELDPTSLYPCIKLNTSTHKYEKYWVQYDNDLAQRRELYDNQIIYISYSQDMIAGYSRISYVERLVRSFNLLRLLENTKVLWTLMNSTFRLRMLVPIGDQSPTKAKETLRDFMAMYKEDFNLDFESGELSIQGSPSKQFWRNYIFPVQDGENVDISTIAPEGPDLQDISLITYFYERLKIDSKIPFGRYDRENNGGQISLSAEQDREEMKFSRFISRLRSIFQEILVKPLTIQMQLDHETLQDDDIFKSKLGLRYVKENYYEKLKYMELLERQVSFIDTMKGVTDDAQDTQIFNTQWLIENYMEFTSDDLKANQKYIEKYSQDQIKDDEEDDVANSWSH